MKKEILSEVLAMNTKTKWSLSGTNAENSVIIISKWILGENGRSLAPNDRDWTRKEPMIKLNFKDKFRVNLLKEKWKIKN